MKKLMIAVVLALVACGDEEKAGGTGSTRQEIDYTCDATECGGVLCCTAYDDGCFDCTYESPNYLEEVSCTGCSSAGIAAACAPNGC